MQALTEYAWPGNVRELENVIERLLVTAPADVVTPRDLPLEFQAPRSLSLRPKRERRRTVADDLYKRLVDERESFWTTVYPLYMQREITRGNVRDLIRKGLEDARGNYKIVAQLFNMEPQRLQAVPELPAQARLPAAVQGIPRSRRVSPRLHVSLGVASVSYRLQAAGAASVHVAADAERLAGSWRQRRRLPRRRRRAEPVAPSCEPAGVDAPGGLRDRADDVSARCSGATRICRATSPSARTGRSRCRSLNECRPPD